MKKRKLILSLLFSVTSLVVIAIIIYEAKSCQKKKNNLIHKVEIYNLADLKTNPNFKLQLSNQITKEEILQAVISATEFNNLTEANDLIITINKANSQDNGAIDITARNSKWVTGSAQFEIPKINLYNLADLKTNPNFKLQLSNQITKEEILQAVISATEFKGLTEANDLIITINKANSQDNGAIDITARNSKWVTGSAQFEIPKINLYNLADLKTNPNFKLQLSNQITKEEVLQAVIIATEFNNLTEANDLIITINKANSQDNGAIDITARDSKWVTGSAQFEIPKINLYNLADLKTNPNFKLQLSNQITKEEILQAVISATEFNNLTEANDLIITINKANSQDNGAIDITARDSKWVTGSAQFEIPKINLYNLADLKTNPNFKLQLSNQITKEEILQAVISATEFNNLTEANDLIITINKANSQDNGAIDITARDSKWVTGSVQFEIPKINLYNLADLKNNSNFKLQFSNQITKEEILQAVISATEFKGLTEANDLIITINKANSQDNGAIDITARDSKWVTGSVQFEIPKINLYNLADLKTNPNFKLQLSNQTSKEEVLQAVISATSFESLNETDDLIIGITKVNNIKDGSIEITARNSKWVTGSVNFIIPQTNLYNLADLKTNSNFKLDLNNNLNNFDVLKSIQMFFNDNSINENNDIAISINKSDYSKDGSVIIKSKNYSELCTGNVNFIIPKLKPFDMALLDIKYDQQWDINDSDTLKNYFLNLLHQITNNNLITIDSFDISISKPSWTNMGYINLSAKDDNKYLINSYRIDIPKTEKFDLAKFSMNNISNTDIEGEYSRLIQKIDSFASFQTAYKRDYTITSQLGTIGKDGYIKITTVKGSLYLKGEVILTIPANPKIDLGSLKIEDQDFTYDDLSDEGKIVKLIRKKYDINEAKLGTDFTIKQNTKQISKPNYYNITIIATSDSNYFVGEVTINSTNYIKLDISKTEKNENEIKKIMKDYDHKDFNNPYTSYGLIQKLFPLNSPGSIGDTNVSVSMPYYGIDGSVRITAKTESTKLEGSLTLRFEPWSPLNINDFDANIFSKLKVENFGSNDIINEFSKLLGTDSRGSIKEGTDFTFSKMGDGRIKITAVKNSKYITGEKIFDKNPPYYQ
ncbi:hypothetical protein EELLY_v1c00870 [Entomoplasma ellychniae]|uniref:Uncharacterized protein n=1 Tax=Entomoplasma ellychniae TaxID=2114 RepID=A0A8E2UCH8_9MOLU|nr:hypothetical protein [Entomoplasma ellychniae]PPE04412.1 hypothetical protein EELLY_v1c00870 [Entomoplasma ellychniae]